METEKPSLFIRIWCKLIGHTWTQDEHAKLQNWEFRKTYCARCGVISNEWPKC